MRQLARAVVGVLQHALQLVAFVIGHHAPILSVGLGDLRTATATRQIVLRSPVVADVHRLVGRRDLFRRGPGLEGFPGRLELRLGRVEVRG